MIKDRLKTIFIILWIAGTLILALPTFQFNLGDQTVKVDYSDRIAKKLNTTLGNFQKSFGIYDSKEVSAALTFTKSDLSDEQKQNTLFSYLKLINDRIGTANLYDVKVRAAISDNKTYSLVFTFPEYYADPAKYVNWLTAKGEISFQTASQESPVTIDLKDFNIQGFINVDYLDTVGTHLVLRFDTEKIGIIQQAFSAGSQGTYFLMSIDSLPSYFVIQYDQYSNTNEELVRILPTQAITLTTTKERNDYINITRSYFQTAVLEDSFTTDTNSILLRPIYRSETPTFIAIMFILGSVLLGIYFYVRFKRDAFIKYLMCLSVFTLTFVVALKVLSGNLSVSLLIGFTLIYFIINAFLYFVFKNNDSEDNVKDALRLMRDSSIVGFLLLTLIYKVVLNLGVMSDLMGAAIIGFILMFVFSVIHFKFIFQMGDLRLARPSLLKLRRNKNEIK